MACMPSALQWRASSSTGIGLKVHPMMDCFTRLFRILNEGSSSCAAADRASTPAATAPFSTVRRLSSAMDRLPICYRFNDVTTITVSGCERLEETPMMKSAWKQCARYPPPVAPGGCCFREKWNDWGPKPDPRRGRRFQRYPFLPESPRQTGRALDGRCGVRRRAGSAGHLGRAAADPCHPRPQDPPQERARSAGADPLRAAHAGHPGDRPDRKSTRLNSSHLGISYAVFCLKKKKAVKALLHT